MTKSQLEYYFEEVLFDLEMNLQSIRRDLTMLLDDYQFEECFACNNLKCCCSPDYSLPSTTISYSSDSAYLDDLEQISMDPYYNAAPPPESLPTPRWPENPNRNDYNDSPTFTTSLNHWVRASVPQVTQSNSSVIFPVPTKVLDHVNYSWPPFPMSIWSDETLKETIEREKMLSNDREREGNSSVEAFFKYFSENQAIPKTALAC